MGHGLQFIFLLLVLVALLSAVYGNPIAMGPSSNKGPKSGPAWNGGDTTDNIILHSNGNWRY